MQCKDCLKEIDDKEYYNKSIEGICKKCRQKMSQIKYENKKFGTNKEYIPARLKNKNTKIVNKKTNKVVSTTKVVEEKEEKIYEMSTFEKQICECNKEFDSNEAVKLTGIDITKEIEAAKERMMRRLHFHEEYGGLNAGLA